MKRRWFFPILIILCFLVAIGLITTDYSSHYTTRELNVGVFQYAQDTSHKVTFHNPSYVLPLTINAPPATGCTCVRVTPPAATITPRASTVFTVSIEASEVGERTEALQFMAKQGFRTKPVHVFMTYRILPKPAASIP